MVRHVAAAAVLLLSLAAVQQSSGRHLLDGTAATAPAAADDNRLTLPQSAMPEATDAAAGTNGNTESGTVSMRIVNGQVATGNFDFMVALFVQGRFFCGGVLLDNTTVLTAAHCVVDSSGTIPPDSLTIWSGQEYAVSEILPHPGYDPSKIPEDNADQVFEGSLHDIAVIKLAAAAAGTPVALVPADTQLESYERLQVAGWGTTESGQTSNQLLYAVVAYLPPGSYCPDDYDDMLCAGGTGQNTCNGDSGGPLLVRDPETLAAYVIGVTSHGPECVAVSTQFAYGYYTDVRLYLNDIATWQAGQQIQWPPATNSMSPTPEPLPATSPPASSGDISSGDIGSSTTWPGLGGGSEPGAGAGAGAGEGADSGAGAGAGAGAGEEENGVAGESPQLPPIDWGEPINWQIVPGWVIAWPEAIVASGSVSSGSSMAAGDGSVAAGGAAGAAGSMESWASWIYCLVEKC